MHTLRTDLRLLALLLTLSVPVTSWIPPDTAMAEAPVASEPTEPILALVASLVLPGLGQIMADEVGRGVWFIVGCIGVWTFAWAVVPIVASLLVALSLGLATFCALPLTIGGLLTIPAYHVWAGVDAYRLARRQRRTVTGEAHDPAPTP